ncbi:Retrovirus-related polyprotein from transposon [Salix suchowensis]|nr:Retrovirus-related polyprotein from transposon [Salix suchowensis]
MKDSETIKEYSDKLMGIANRIRLLGTSFADSRIVEKLLVIVPEKYEASITTLENTKDLSNITLTELLNALQAQEQRRLMRQDHAIEGALQAKFPDSDKKFFRKNSDSSSIKPNQGYNKGKFIKRNFPPCQHCNKSGHLPFKCWKRLDARCSKCNQLGHEAIICIFKNQKQEEDAQVVNQDDEDQMFVATCFSVQTTSDHWLIDSGCTNHMTFDKIAKVRIGNGECIEAKEKGTIAITTNSGSKTIAHVLYVPDIDQNLLSVGQLIEKGMKVIFENQYCCIFYATGHKILQARMKGKSFSFLPFEEEHNAFPTKLNYTELWHKRLGHCHQ